MGLGITHEEIVAAIVVHLDASLTVSTQVCYPGEVVDTESNDDWIEVVVTSADRPPQRRTNKDRRRVLLDVYCWAKLTTSRYRIWDLVVDVADQLEHKEIDIKTYTSVSSNQSGYLRVGEPRRRDLTRTFNDPNNTKVRGVVLTFPCWAYED